MYTSEYVQNLMNAQFPNFTVSSIVPIHTREPWHHQSTKTMFFLRKETNAPYEAEVYDIGLSTGTEIMQGTWFLAHDFNLTPDLFTGYKITFKEDVV